MLYFPKVYSQKSEPWNKEKLGNSELEIEDFGCLITNETNIANYFGNVCNVSAVNKRLKDNGGFDGANYVWGSMPKLFPNIKEIYKRTASALKDADITEIKKSIDRGNPVMIWIDYNPATVKNDMHWVVIVAYDEKDENNFTIIDPIDGKTRSLKEYLKFLIGSARRTIEAYVIYEGDAKPQTIDALQKENETLKSKLDEIKLILNN